MVFKADIMAPFCHLLSAKTEFLWSQEMKDTFKKAKLEISPAVSDRVCKYKKG